ncbi:hypothetical protein EIN_217940 [Entamoeba invadens IP1]|uniref:Uncharacterized protein n=1 Tax=Entamoeba invadens IP1 TaxID=370355 RepID=L7FPG4_ENTIV|nr:hypothetical protein EIN_217940 [Entamoeba invadens IP1]ELP95329.1 hypothetical protein EIN_217940 [Entamoeba invadens IP1]|eukprot:XP_004262100.1 hypothetical protein EIN_217940 [Entamoeba invadens IP1]
MFIFETFDSIIKKNFDIENTKVHFISVQHSSQSYVKPELNEFSIITVSLSGHIKENKFHTILGQKNTAPRQCEINGITYSDAFPSPQEALERFHHYFNANKNMGVQIFVFQRYDKGYDPMLDRVIVSLLRGIDKDNSSMAKVFNDYTYITLGKLLDTLLKKFDINYNRKELEKDIDKLFKIRKLDERCDYHKTVESRFACSREETESMINTFYAILLRFNVPIQKFHYEIPQVISNAIFEKKKAPFSFENNFVVMFTNFIGTQDKVFELLLCDISVKRNEASGMVEFISNKNECFEHVLPSGVSDSSSSIELFLVLLDYYEDQEESKNKFAKTEIEKFCKNHCEEYFVTFDCDLKDLKNLGVDGNYLNFLNKNEFFQCFCKEFGHIENFEPKKFCTLFESFHNVKTSDNCCFVHKQCEKSLECVHYRSEYFIFVLNKLVNTPTEIQKYLNIETQESRKEIEAKKEQSGYTKEMQIKERKETTIFIPKAKRQAAEKTEKTDDQNSGAKNEKKKQKIVLVIPHREKDYPDQESNAAYFGF